MLGCTHVGTEPQLLANLSASNINMSTSTEGPHRQDRENLLVGQYEMLLVVFLAKISLPLARMTCRNCFRCDAFSEKNKPQNAILINKCGGLEKMSPRAVGSFEEVIKFNEKFYYTAAAN